LFNDFPKDALDHFATNLPKLFSVPLRDMENYALVNSVVIPKIAELESELWNQFNINDENQSLTESDSESNLSIPKIYNRRKRNRRCHLTTPSKIEFPTLKINNVIDDEEFLLSDSSDSDDDPELIRIYKEIKEGELHQNLTNGAPTNKDRMELRRHGLQRDFDLYNYSGVDDNSQEANINNPNILEEAELESIISTSDFMEWAGEWLNELAGDLHFSLYDDYTTSVSELFYSYINISSEKSKIQWSGDDDIAGYLNYLLNHPKYHYLMKIGRRLAVIPSSEASAERLFSAEKRIAGADRAQTKLSLETGRLFYNFQH
jgi:hypothetical protein